MRVVVTLLCLAVLAGMPVAQAAASTRLAAQMSGKEADTARLIQLAQSIETLTVRLRTDPSNTTLQTKYNAAVAEYNAISARLGGDRAPVTEAQAPTRGTGGGPPPPPNCTASNQVFTQSTPVAIPTGPAVVTSTLVVAGAGTFLSDVNVTTGITHTFNADLDITVTSPAGTVVTLTTDNGSSFDNVFNGTVWDDDADPGTQVPYTSNPNEVTEHTYADLTLASPLLPEEGLGAFVGQDPNGTWTITISDDAAGDGGALNSWSLNLTSLTSAPTLATTSATNSTPVAIPTGPAVVTSTINIAGAGTSLLDVNVTTGITHTFNNDLDVTVMSPAGTVVTLTTDNGGSNDNVFNGTVWDDDADPGTQVPYTANPNEVTEHTYADLTLASPLLPEEALASFNGEDPNGTWTITISDDLAGDGGSLNSWTLDLTTGSCAIIGGGCQLTCPADQLVTATDAMGAVVNYPAPTDNGQCGPITCVPPSGSSFPVGTTTVICTAPDNVPNDPSGTVTTVYSSGNIAVPIPDNNPSGASVMINVPDTGTVMDVNVRLRLNHTFDSDLAIGLSHASSGNALSNNNGGSGDNYGTGNNDCSGTPTVFDDQAMTSISSGTAPFAGSFIPQSGLSIHNGSDASGLWTLTAVDNAGLDTGTIGCVELEITRDVTGGGGGAQCAFNVTVSIPFDSCCVDDGTGDTFRQVVASVPPGSPLYGFWQYQVAATNEVFTGTANRVSYRPGLSLIMDDNVTVNYAMHAEIDYPRKKCRVQVTERPTLRRFVLRDRDITNNMCAPAPPPPPPAVVKNQ